MIPRRRLLTHYRIAGRNEPTVLVSKSRQTSSHSLQSAKVANKRKAGPCTVSFRVEGSLNPPANDDLQDSMSTQSGQAATEAPSSSPPSLDVL
jgi:hypothetical protein